MQSKAKRPIFLLGGIDLEMNVIKDLLKRNQQTYFDEQLKWDNAFLSQYEDTLEKYADTSSVELYGIELTEDIIPPDNYKRIDHHNDFSNRPASLIQLMNLLDIPVERYHQLVAANDQAYIAGMRELQATEEEIQKIRKIDRQLQGVTDKDELLAEESIRENAIQLGSLTIIRSKTSHFSTITDRLYPYQCLLIHTDNEATYYGHKVMELKKRYATQIQEHKIYYGGNDSYIGIAKDAFDEKEFKDIINQIIEIHR